ncbi:MAG TPA: selenium cofactor biosynthesis protein YqeC [Smithella sp.]|nr:selenium cofactor biosynthesis protein YqeC [Smithella sp.]HOG91236.1 selenium cofactor biosynthesis protein YqeC [Smithella sp.]
MGILADLHLDPHARELVCLIGAGGKTSVMFNLASTLKTIGKKILVTTTTKIYLPEKEQYDSMVFDSSDTLARLEKSKPGTITCLGKGLHENDHKVIGVDKERVDQLFDSQLFDWILAEGDGARGKSIKAPDVEEPVIPERTTLALGLIGLDALGKKANDENVHRSRLFCNVTGAKENDRIDESLIARLIVSPKGLFKNVPADSRRMVLLNKADVMPDNKVPLLIHRIVEKEDRNISIAIISAKEDRVFQW